MPTSTDDPFEALQISKNERGRVDIAYIEELTGKDYDTVVSELGNAVFRDPEMADENDTKTTSIQVLYRRKNTFRDRSFPNLTLPVLLPLNIPNIAKTWTRSKQSSLRS